MRQKLISWMLEDIAPEIRKNHDPEGSILKFANEQNLEPALVQALGQIYNTGMTLSFIGKAAGEKKGDDFPILDVDKMLDKYLEVRPAKEARNSAPGSSVYDQLNLGGDQDDDRDLAACFRDYLGVTNVENGVTVSDTPAVKSARQILRDDSERKLTLQLLDQICSDSQEDAQEILQKVAMQIKRDEIPFEKLASDVLSLYGETLRPVVVLLGNFCTAVHVKVASNVVAGPERLIKDHVDLLSQLDQVSECLFKIAEAKLLIKEADQGEVGTEKKVDAGKKDMTPKNTFKGDSHPMAPEPSARPARAVPAPSGRAPETKHAPSRPVVKPVMDAASTAAEPITNAPAIYSGAKDLLGNGYNSDQEHVDNSVGEAQHLATLQNLMTTDDVLSEADPEKVVAMFETLRKFSPSLAAEPNIARVALRSMVQHDGMSPFDVKSLLDTEGARQKVDFNTQLDSKMRYGGAAPSAPSRPG